jgi:hypothetical protein
MILHRITTVSFRQGPEVSQSAYLMAVLSSYSEKQALIAHLINPSYVCVKGQKTLSKILET